jgi:hypothetical protein
MAIQMSAIGAQQKMSLATAIIWNFLMMNVDVK